MESTISSAVLSITSTILGKITVAKNHFNILINDGEEFDIELFSKQILDDSFSDFKSLYDIDESTTFYIVFNKTASLVANYTNNLRVTDLEFAELSIYMKYFSMMNGKNFKIICESTFNKFLENSSQLVIHFPKRNNLHKTLISIAESIIDNGAQPNASILSSISNQNDFLVAFLFFVRINNTQDLAFERLNAYLSQIPSADGKSAFYNLISPPIMEMYRSNPKLLQRKYSKKTFDTFVSLLQTKAGKDPENIEFPSLLLSLCLKDISPNNDNAQYIIKQAMDIKKIRKRSRELSALAFIQLLSSIIYGGDNKIQNDILNTRQAFNSYYFNKKGANDLQGFITENVLPRFFAYDLILNKGEETIAQKYIIENINVEGNSAAMIEGLYIVLCECDSFIQSINQTLLLEAFNQIKTNLKFKKGSLQGLFNWFFDCFSKESSYQIISNNSNVVSVFFDILFIFLRKYPKLENFAQKTILLLFTLFNQRYLKVNDAIILELLYTLNLTFQRLIISNDPYFAYAPQILFGFANYTCFASKDGSCGLNENNKTILSITTYVECVLNIPLFDEMKRILHIPNDIQMNSPILQITKSDTVLTIIKMWLSIASAATNGKVQSILNYDVDPQANNQTIVSFADYLFQNSSAILGRHNAEGFKKEPITVYYESLFMLFNYGSGSMTPLIEKAKNIEKMCAPLLISTATSVLSPEGFDSSMGSKKLWAQTLKLMNTAVSIPEIRSFSFKHLETFLLTIFEKLQFSSNALESDIFKQPLLTLTTFLYEDSSKATTSKRMSIINSLLRMAEMEYRTKGRAMARIINSITKLFEKFTIDPRDSLATKDSVVSDYDVMKYASDRIAKLFAIIADIVRDEPEEENDIKNAAFQLFLKIIESNCEYCYPAYLHYARQSDSIFGQIIRDVLTTYLRENDETIKNVYCTNKLLQDNFNIFLQPPNYSYSFYISAIKHVVASMQSDPLFDMMAENLAKLNNPPEKKNVYKYFFASWFYLAATPQVVENSFKCINTKRNLFDTFIPHGSFPYYLKKLSNLTKLPMEKIFDEYFIRPILETPLPFGVTFSEFKKAKEYSTIITQQLSQFFDVLDSVNVSYFSLPNQDLTHDIKRIHHFLDDVPVPYQDMENYQRCDEVFLRLFNSNFFVCNDKDLKRRKYWLLTTKSIPPNTTTQDITEFINQTLPSNHESIICIDAEANANEFLNDFNHIIEAINDKIECAYLYRAGFGIGSKIANLYGDKFNTYLDTSIFMNSIFPISMPIEELAIPGIMPDVDDLKCYLYDDRIEFSAIEKDFPVFATINLADITKVSSSTDVIVIETVYRTVRVTTEKSQILLKIIESWKETDQVIIKPTMNYEIDPLYEILSISLFTVTSTEADTSSKAISLFFAALGKLKGPIYKSEIRTNYGFSMPIQTFLKQLGSYKKNVIPIMALNNSILLSSASSEILVDTLNDQSLPNSVISSMLYSIVLIYHSNLRAQASLKKYLFTQITSPKVVEILIPIIAQFSEPKSFGELMFCMLKNNAQKLFDTFYSTLIKNEISGMAFYQFILKPSFYGIISNLYTKDKTVFDGREATTLFISAIGLTLYPSDSLKIFVDFFTQYLTHYHLDDILEKFNNATPDPKVYLSIVNEAAQRSSDYDEYKNFIYIMAHSGYPDAIIISSNFDETQAINTIKRAFSTQNSRRLIYALENTSDFILNYNKHNVHPLFIIWSAFPLLQSDNQDVQGASIDLIHSTFTFVKDTLKYPSILDVSSSINQSDLLSNTLNQFSETLFNGFDEVFGEFEAYFGLVLAASLVRPLSNQSLREKAKLIINDALNTIPQTYDAIYFIILAIAFTDISIESILEKAGDKEATFTSIVCQDAENRTPYEAIWIAKALFLGLTTREDRSELFADALISFLKIRNEIPTISSRYMLKVLTPIIEAQDISNEQLMTLSKVIAVATISLPYGSDIIEIQLDSPEPAKITADDLNYHFSEVILGIEDCIQTAFRFE